MPTRLKSRYRGRIAHRHFVSRSTSDDLLPTFKCLAELGGISTISTTITLVHWVDSCHRDTDLQIPPPVPPSKSLDSDIPSVAPLTSINHRSCRALSLGCRKCSSRHSLPLAPATHLAWIPGHPSRGHIFVLPSTIQCAILHLFNPLTSPTTNCN